MSDFVPDGYVRLHTYLGRVVKDMLSDEGWAKAWGGDPSGSVSHFVAPAQIRASIASKRVVRNLPVHLTGSPLKDLRIISNAAHSSAALDEGQEVKLSPGQRSKLIDDAKSRNAKRAERLAPVLEASEIATARITQDLYASRLAAFLIDPGNGRIVEIPSSAWGSEARLSMWDTGTYKHKAAPLSGARAPILIRDTPAEVGIEALPSTKREMMELALRHVYPDTGGIPPDGVFLKVYHERAMEWLRSHHDWHNDMGPISTTVTRVAAGKK